MAEAEYGEVQAKKGLTDKLPEIEVFPNQTSKRDYVIEIVNPEYSSVCPKTGMPDYGTIYLEYVPDALCIELKSLKYYYYAYRDLGIFYENLANRILDDVIAACLPKRCLVKAEMTPRGGIRSVITAEYVKPAVA